MTVEPSRWVRIDRQCFSHCGRWLESHGPLDFQKCRNVSSNGVRHMQLSHNRPMTTSCVERHEDPRSSIPNLTPNPHKPPKLENPIATALPVARERRGLWVHLTRLWASTLPSRVKNLRIPRESSVRLNAYISSPLLLEPIPNHGAAVANIEMRPFEFAVIEWRSHSHQNVADLARTELKMKLIASPDIQKNP